MLHKLGLAVGQPGGMDVHERLVVQLVQRGDVHREQRLATTLFDGQQLGPGRGVGDDDRTHTSPPYEPPSSCRFCPEM